MADAGMTSILDEEDESLAHFLESEVLSEVSDQEEEEQPKLKRIRLQENDKLKETVDTININKNKPRRIETGLFSKIPPELFRHILKFLSSEDLLACSLVCRFLNYAASDESLWRRLYCMRWGLLPPTKKLSQSAWKKLYIQRDQEDTIKLVRNCPPEFKEYYIQMQVAKRSQAPLPSQGMQVWVACFRTTMGIGYAASQVSWHGYKHGAELWVISQGIQLAWGEGRQDNSGGDSC